MKNSSNSTKSCLKLKSEEIMDDLKNKLHICLNDGNKHLKEITNSLIEIHSVSTNIVTTNSMESF